MGEYIPFSREDVDRASQTNLVEFLRRRGETLKRSGGEWQWGEGSNKVTIRENEWFHQYELVGGDAIAFVRRWYNLNFPEAVTFLLTEQNAAIPEPMVRVERIGIYIGRYIGIVIILQLLCAKKAQYCH